MTVLDYAIIFFVIMETANVCILYFAPDSRLGNGVAVFDNYHESKEDENRYLFTKYMTNWVAGVKLIFIVLLSVILFTADETTKLCAVGVMILSIATYFFRLNPIIKKLDKNGKITPKGYSKTLFLMIAGFIALFSAALVVYIIQNY
ncbi:MAG: hypothetical protein R3Y36_06440 [Spirochaetales bacterium]